MSVTTFTHGATAAAASAFHSARRPRRAAHLDPYMVWMVRNLPSDRAWHR